MEFKKGEKKEEGFETTGKETAATEKADTQPSEKSDKDE